jgi:A nuclease family of the HNH/ENDO VII superfamily with conserved AHH
MQQAIAPMTNLRIEYEAWLRDPANLGKPVPSKYTIFVPKISKENLEQGGLMGTSEYKITRARYDTYGKYLPVISDIDDLKSFAEAVKEGKVDDAVIFAVGFLVPEVSGKMLKGPLHHIATNKNFIRGQQWSKKFAPLFEKAGYKLDDAINKIHVPGHKGPHPDEYHEAIFDRIQAATRGLDGDDYKRAFDNTLETLGKEVTTKGSYLNKLLTKEN